MTIDISFPVLPPTLDGIGDHTAHLAHTLAQSHQVRVLTAQRIADPIPNVDVCPVFDIEPRRGVKRLVEAVADAKPDWFLLQYNPFSYGNRGFNIHLPRAIHQIRTVSPGTRIAVMVHEPFVPRSNWRFAIMWTWQRLQFKQIGVAADVLLFSIDPWAEIFRPWFPNATVAHLPVGSNIPMVEPARDAVRHTLGIRNDALVVGVFGGAHPSRLLPMVRAGIESISETHGVEVLYVGSAGSAIKKALGPVSFHDAGALPGEDVSRHFSAMDIYLAPFKHGVSTRRGSFLVGLQHGLPSVSTYGPHTGNLLRKQDGNAFLLVSEHDGEAYVQATRRLVNDDALRMQFQSNSRSLFGQVFAWKSITGRLLDILHRHERGEVESVAAKPVAAQ